MQEHSKLAVIMPAYNAEKYIEKAVSSILAQSFSDLTVTVVNDGSTDGTEECVSRLAEKDSRVHLLNVENGGPAKARNAGLEAVRGCCNYIMFADADDELLPDAVEKAISAAESGSDLVFFGFTIVNPDGTRNDYFEPDAVLPSGEIGDTFTNLYKANLLNQVWAKLFRASLIYDNGIDFQDYRWGEDRLFIFDCLEKASSISVLSYCGYLYMMHTGSSLITGFYDKKATVCALADIRAQELCNKFGVTDDRFFRYMFAKSIFSCMTNLFSDNCRLNREEKRAYIEHIISNDYIQERCSNTAGGLPVRIITAIMRTRNISLNMFAARFASFAGRAFPKLFQMIKHKK